MKIEWKKRKTNLTDEQYVKMKWIGHRKAGLTFLKTKSITQFKKKDQDTEERNETVNVSFPIEEKNCLFLFNKKPRVRNRIFSSQRYGKFKILSKLCTLCSLKFEKESLPILGDGGCFDSMASSKCYQPFLCTRTIASCFRRTVWQTIQFKTQGWGQRTSNCRVEKRKEDNQRAWGGIRPALAGEYC